MRNKLLTKLVRNIPPQVLAALSMQAPRRAMPETIKEGKEARPNTNEVIVHTLAIRALGPSRWYKVAEIEEIALRIARLQRNARELQERARAHEKLLKEKQELAELLQHESCGEDEVMYRAASVVYYSAYRYLYNYEVATFDEEMHDLSHKTALPERLLLDLCLAKFRPRSFSPVADKVYEYEEIRRCKSNFERFSALGENCLQNT